MGGEKRSRAATTAASVGRGCDVEVGGAEPGGRPLGRTLFVFRRELLGVIQAAASQRVAVQERARLARDVEKAGLVEDGALWLDQASTSALDMLAAMGQATSRQLREAVPLLGGSTVYAPHKPYGGAAPVAPRVLTTMSASGTILRASNQGRWNVSRPLWSTTGHWLGALPVVPPEPQARADLVRRWLYAFGPATVADLKWWLGSTLTAVRAALSDVGAVEVDLHGHGGVALADDLDPVEVVEPFAALLPGLDPTTMGWFERDWYVGGHRSMVFDSNGNAGPTAWWDGHVVGGWHQPTGAEVVVQLLEVVGTEGRVALESEATRLTAWLDGTRVSPRFPSPLSR
ncbi:MAG: DNA glycosylase AlkZ-like family protein [Acidimicrobiales bacterium]